MTNTIQSAPTSEKEKRKALEKKNLHVLGALLLIFVGVPLGLYILFWLGSWLGIQALWAPPIIEPWGTVTTVRFVGGLRTATQVTTDQKTFLLKGIANVPLASVVERR